MAKKTIAIFENWNPNQKGVTHIAMQMGSQPYVFSTYRVKNERDLPTLGRDIPIVPIGEARKYYTFKEGKLADIAQAR